MEVSDLNALLAENEEKLVLNDGKAVDLNCAVPSRISYHVSSTWS